MPYWYNKSVLGVSCSVVASINGITQHLNWHREKNGNILVSLLTAPLLGDSIIVNCAGGWGWIDFRVCRRGI